MSPEIEIETQQITWDEEKAQLFLEVAQKFHIRWSPLRVATSRYVQDGFKTLGIFLTI